MPATPPDRAWIKCSCCTFNEDKPFSRGTVVGKTGKTSVLTWFFGVEHGVGSSLAHKLQTPSEEIAFTAQPKIKSQSQILSYSQSMFCLPHRPKISDFFDLCLHWVSLLRGLARLWCAGLLLTCLKYSAAPLNSVLCGISHAKKLVFSATELNMQKPIRPN